MNQLITLEQQQNQISDQVRNMIDRIFENLAASCPILLSVSGEQLEILKQQWILVFAENGIRTFEQIKRGMTASHYGLLAVLLHDGVEFSLYFWLNIVYCSDV